MREFSRRDILATGAAASLGLLTNGCGEFFRSQAIKDKTNEILDAEKQLIQKYLEEAGVDRTKHPQREQEAFFTINEDSSYTLFYPIEFADPASLEEVVKEQFKDSEVSLVSGINQLVVRIKDKSQLSILEELLGNIDKLPPQVVVRFRISCVFGDKAQDYASQFGLSITSQGREFGAVTGSSTLPGASERLFARATMGTKWGAEIDTEAVKMQAIIDVLKTYGYVEHIYHTDLRLSNGKEASLGEDEKLPLQVNNIVGPNQLITWQLEPVKSSVQVTAQIFNSGIVSLKLTVSLGSAKRPEIKRADFQVPVHEEISNEGVYTWPGNPIVIAGKLNRFTLGLIRQDAFFPFPSSQDYEERVSRVYYEVTPIRIHLYDESALRKVAFKYKELKSTAP